MRSKAEAKLEPRRTWRTRRKGNAKTKCDYSNTAFSSSVFSVFSVVKSFDSYFRKGPTFHEADFHNDPHQFASIWRGGVCAVIARRRKVVQRRGEGSAAGHGRDRTGDNGASGAAALGAGQRRQPR